MALLVSRWIDGAAWAILSIGGAFRPTRKFQVVEQEDLAFAVTALRRRSAQPVAGSPFALSRGNLSRTRESGLGRGLRADKSRSSSQGVASYSGPWSCRSRH